VRRDGNQVRITAQLIDAGSDDHLWAESYDREAVDVFAVQDEIARRVAGALEIELDAASGALGRRGTRDPEAYELYRRGRFLWSTRTREAHEQAIAYYWQAIARDSSYADPYAGLADAYLTSYQLGLATMPEAEVYSRLKWAAERALALDEQSADAHIAFSSALWWQRNWPGAERELRRAIELNPGHATARSWYSMLLGGMGRVDEARQQGRRAAESDPFAVLISLTYAGTLYMARDYAGAVEQFRRTLEINDAWAPTHAWLSVTYAQMGMYEPAIRAGARAVELGPGVSMFAANLAYAYARAGREPDARRLLQRAKAERVDAFGVARVHVALGEPDSAFVWLERSPWQWPHRANLHDPTLDPLRSDPRFARLSARVEREMGIR